MIFGMDRFFKWPNHILGDVVLRLALQRSKRGRRVGEARDVQRRFPASRCWSSTVIHLPIAPITPCRKQSSGVATNLLAPSLALRTCCCASTAMSSRTNRAPIPLGA